MLIAAKTAHHALNSQYINLQRAGHSLHPAVELNGDDARARGIASGDAVTVFNERGAVSLHAEVSARTAPGVVSVPFNWWPRNMANGSSANALTADGIGHLGSGSDAFDTFVEVRAGA
jgi:anaerobic selenocysteine-containing dehydrogenase